MPGPNELWEANEMTKYAESQLEEARQMRAAGEKWCVVEMVTGVGRDTIHYHDKKKLLGRASSLTDEQKIEARALRKRRVKVYKIAQLLGVTYSCANYWANKKG